MALGLPHELERDVELDVVRDGVAAFGELGVEVETVVTTIDDRLQLDTELVVAGEVRMRAGDAAASGHPVGVALDAQLALDLELALLADVDPARDEPDLGIALGVEEVGCTQMRGEVLVLDDDRAGADAAAQRRLSVLADAQRACVVLE